MTREPSISIRRAYDAPGPHEGTRILVDGLWPRGVRKEALVMDRWARELAPSAELRKWFGHDPERWADFVRRYRVELEARAELLEPVLRAARTAPVTLLYGTRDAEHNNAVVLRDFLLERLGAEHEFPVTLLR